MGEQALSILPGLGWVAFAFTALLLLRRPIAERLRHIRSVSAMGVQVTMDPQAAAEELGTAAYRRDIPVDADRLTLLVDRAKSMTDGIARTRVLWIDDAPALVIHERVALTKLGVVIDTVTTDQDAYALLSADPSYGLMISDIRRGQDDAAGITFLQRLRSNGIAIPVIFYTGRVDPSRQIDGAQAVVDDPADLLKEVLIVVQRASGQHWHTFHRWINPSSPPPDDR